jgi:hypothetical protein
MSKELETFVPESTKVTLADGTKLEIKPLNWGKEIKVCQLVSKFFSDNALLEAFNNITTTEGANDLDAISKLIIPLVNEAPQVITEILALVINKDNTYVEESLTSEDVMQIFVPFLQNLFTRYTKIFQKVKLK